MRQSDHHRGQVTTLLFQTDIDPKSLENTWVMAS